jgi:hypothetical protein
MKNPFIIICAIGLLCQTIYSASGTLSDISTSDPAYPAAQSAVKNGYLVPVDDNKFLPNQAVTRKELAVIIQKMDALTEKSALSANDIVSLKDFAKQFKAYLASQENEQGLFDTEMDQVKTQQKTLNYDLTRIEDHLQKVEKKHAETTIYIWVGVGLGILGLLR